MIIEYRFIILGGLSAIILFSVLFFKFDMKLKRILIYIISLILSLLLSKILLDYDAQYISKIFNGTYSITNSYYLTMVIFLVFIVVFNKILLINTKKTGKLLAAPLMIFLAVSKIGCYFNGCCFAVIGDKIIPLNLIESALSFITLILILFNKVKPDIIILTFYSIFRFITDFVKTSYEYENLNGLTMFQILYLIVIFITIMSITKKYIRGLNKYEKI